MADQSAPDNPGAVGESPILVRVTIERGTPRGATRGRSRLLGLLGAIIAVVAMAFFAGAAVTAVSSHLPKSAERPLRAQAPQARNAGPVGVAAAYRYPLACLSVTIATADPAFAAARLNRASPCWRYGVYAIAIFHRVAGVWRMAPEASGASCATTSIPANVRAQLGLCNGGSGQSTAVARSRRDG